MTLATSPNAGIPVFSRYDFRRRAPNGDERLTAAGILFTTPDGRALFTRRAGADHAGEWAFPGGVVEQDEEPSDAARREAIEEIGSLPAWEIEGLDRTTSPEGVDFVTFRQDGDAFVPRLNGEHDDYLWADLREPPEPLHPAVANLLATYFREEAAEPEHGWETEQLAREFGEAARDQKLTQESVDYALSDDGIDRCEVCIYYRALGPHVAGCLPGETLEEACEHSVADGPHCTLVEDPIIANGWCRLFKAPVEDVGEDVEMNRIKSIKIKFDNDEPAEDARFEESEHPRGEAGKFAPIGSFKTMQAAGETNKATVNRYRDQIKSGQKLKPLEVVRNQETGANHILDGHHRFFAGKAENLKQLPIRVAASVKNAKEATAYYRAVRFGDELPADVTQDEAIALDQQGSVREFDQDGRMRVAKAHISKSNICPYKGSEIPDGEALGLDPNKVYMLYRDPDELKKAADSFNGIQLLRRHIPVDAEDHRAWDIVGTTGTECAFNEPYLDNSLVVWAQDGIDDIESERKRELSAGYHYRADMTPGSIDGKPFDGVMRDIVGNHVALVETGRAGSDVVVGDSMESLMAIAPLPSHFAVLAEAAVRSALPPLKPGTKLDLSPVFKNLTAKSFDKKKVRLALDGALKGKLAKDADLSSLTSMLDHLDSTKNPKTLDESVSGAQHRAMGAAASGEGKLGIPKSTAEEFLDKDRGKTFSDQGENLGEHLNVEKSGDADPNENLTKFLRGKGLSEDDIRTACDISRGGARDQAVGGVESGGETPGATSGEGAKATEKASVGGKDEEKDAFAATRADLVDKAKEKETGEDAMPKDMVTKQAMDTAIRAATEAVRANVLKSQREIRMALDEVRPYVGELSSALAFDAAEDVYREALKVKDPELALDGIHPSAYRHILTKGYAPAGAREPAARSNGASLGMDEATRQSFNERFPNAARIGVA